MENKAKAVSFSPEEVFLNAFEHYKASRLDLASLIRIALSANCPNPDVAQGVLNQMVNRRLLKWVKDEENVVWFSVIKPKEEKIRLN